MKKTTKKKTSKRKKQKVLSSVPDNLDPRKFRVTIFGSARVKKGTPLYDQIYTLGKMLGERDISLITGGGPGLMEAATSGHAKGNKKESSKTIGLSIKLPHEQKIPPSVNVKVRFKRFSRRLDNFMLYSNVIIVAPGGIGTLLELMYAWQLVKVNHICHVPIILLGPMWKGLIKWMEKTQFKQGFITKEDLGSVFLAKNCKQAIRMIDNAQIEFAKGTSNYCLNYKKYKLY